jgi:misacylated tRNA(Ala) deacylase
MAVCQGEGRWFEPINEDLMTAQRYLDDPYLRDVPAEVTASADGCCALSQTVFYPGGGGQPCDRGQLLVGADVLPVSSVREDESGRIWHCVGRDLAVGTGVHAEIDWAFRHALMRHHALLHIVNTLARDRYGGMMTGCQLGPERSRIDLRLPAFSREQLPDLEASVNEVIERGLAVTSSIIAEDEYSRRPGLIRTLNVSPPIIDGQVRIVTMAGFDAQACGGTHVHSTAEIGRARLVKFDNKGKDNKRLYWELGA